MEDSGTNRPSAKEACVTTARTNARIIRIAITRSLMFILIVRLKAFPLFGSRSCSSFSGALDTTGPTGVEDNIYSSLTRVPVVGDVPTGLIQKAL
jgi:hypothetical protein